MPPKKTARKKTVTKKAVKKTTKVVKKVKPKAKPVKKIATKKAPAKKKAATVKRNPVPKGMIPLTLSLGTNKFYGYLKPLPFLGTWGGPEALDIIVAGPPGIGGQATISSATGTWVVQNQVALPASILAEIILTIQKHYNGKGLNTPQ